MCIANVDVFYKQMIPVTFIIIDRHLLVTHSLHPVFRNENEVERKEDVYIRVLPIFFF